MPGDLRASLLQRSPESEVVDLLLDGDPEGVRDGLSRLMDNPLLSQLGEDSQGTVQIVLAEVLNNIAEHAYARYPGQIEVLVVPQGGAMYFRTQDRGLPMPEGRLPGGVLSEAKEFDDLPEGGFGWFLIRSLTRDLTYARQDHLNLLSFCIDVDYRR
jgi:serine/threonine-protein kinase RsbW